jgi:hypothetical protein
MRMIFGLQFHNICFLLLLILIAIVWLSDENEENLKKKVSKLTSENNQLKMLVKRFDSENKLRYKKRSLNKGDQMKSSESNSDVTQSNENEKREKDHPKMDNSIKIFIHEIIQLREGNRLLEASLTKCQSDLIDKKRMEEEEKQVDCMFHEPSKEYEMTRRRIQRDLNELWHYISSRLQEATEELRRKLSEKQLASLLKKTLLNIRHRYNVLKADIDSLAEVDGYDDWRKKESKELTSIVENRLKEIQNPLNCQAAKTLVCKLNINCGYGCQSHHAVYCLNLALATKRTLIFDPDQTEFVLILHSLDQIYSLFIRN